MIKRGDKGTVGGNKAIVIYDHLKGDYPLVIAVESLCDTEEIVVRAAHGGSTIAIPFIPSKPWDSLKPGDACFAKEYESCFWRPGVYAGISEDNLPLTFDADGKREWNHCVPAKLVDGELVPVEEE